MTVTAKDGTEVTVTTFEEKRQKLLHEFDEAVVELRGVVSDKNWNNEAFRPFQEATSRLHYAIQKIKTLNEAEIS